MFRRRDLEGVTENCDSIERLISVSESSVLALCSLSRVTLERCTLICAVDWKYLRSFFDRP
jgi:hypothetical protein